MDTAISKRDNSIDILRFIGLSCIILAHIMPPSTLCQLRTFDVPLMVFISGLAYAGRPTGDYVDFVKRRLFRLIVPVYIFLCFYFVFTFIFAQLGFIQQTPLITVAGSFLFVEPSIGYVWVIRVFLIIMLITPLLVKIEKQIKPNRYFIGLIAAILLVQLTVTQGFIPPSQLQGWLRLVGEYFFYLVYSVPFLIGLRLRCASKKDQWLIISILAFAFACMAIFLYATKGEWLIMQIYKYPPCVYFILWGTLISSLLWATKGWWQRAFELKPILFTAQNTIWIYLWHIPFVLLANNLLVEAGWLSRYVVVYCSALFVVYLQSQVVDFIDKTGGDRGGFIKRYFKG